MIDFWLAKKKGMNEEIFPLARVSFIIFNYEKKAYLSGHKKEEVYINLNN